MTAYIISLGIILFILYMLGLKTQRTDNIYKENFKQNLDISRQQCREIALEFADHLSAQKKKHSCETDSGRTNYDEWYRKDIEKFLHSTVLPRMSEPYRSLLLNYGNYAGIIDNVAKTADQKVKKEVRHIPGQEKVAVAINI